jgi:hypothetical protein
LIKPNVRSCGSMAYVTPPRQVVLSPDGVVLAQATGHRQADLT